MIQTMSSREALQMGRKRTLVAVLLAWLSVELGCEAVRHELVKEQITDNDIVDGTRFHLQASKTGKWLALSQDEAWMLILVDEQPSEDQQFSMHRWGAEQVQIMAPNGKWLWVENGGGNGAAVMATSEENSIAAWETFTLEPIGSSQVRILSVDNSSCVGYSAEDWNWDILRTFGCQRGEVGNAEATNVEWDGKDVLWNVVRTVQRLGWCSRSG